MNRKLKGALFAALLVFVDAAYLDCASAQVNAVPALGNRDTSGASYANIEGQKASYFAGLGANTPAATPTDIAIVTGSATKLVKVTKVRLTLQATAAGLVEYRLVLRSGGTQSAVNTAFANGTHSGPLDSADVASTVITAGLAGVYTSNPASSGTTVGVVDDWATGLGANATTILEYVCREPSKCITLRGTGQVLAVNGNGHALLAGEKVGVQFVWTEE